MGFDSTDPARQVECLLKLLPGHFIVQNCQKSHDLGCDLGCDLGRDLGRDLGCDLGCELGCDFRGGWVGDWAADWVGDLGPRLRYVLRSCGDGFEIFRGEWKF